MSENNFQNILPKMPELRVSKNGYEIRTDILSMAKDLVGQEYHAKYLGQMTSKYFLTHFLESVLKNRLSVKIF